LDAEGITPDAYDLTGEGRDEAYALRETPSGWMISYSERGLERDVETYGTEQEACERLLMRMRNDPTTR
jgi:hypothetical protein